MSIEDFKRYEEWSRYREELRGQAAEVQVAPEPVVLATWGRRLGAYLIDSILLAIPLVIYLFSNMPDLSAIVGRSTRSPASRTRRQCRG